MLDEILALLPSKDLHAKIKETGHVFSETDLLRMICEYAPTFDMRIEMLAHFAEVVSSDLVPLVRFCIDHENEKQIRFMEEADGFVYELHIKETPRSADERYICSSYAAALSCIDGFWREYAHIDAKEREETRYIIEKHKLITEDGAFFDGSFGECYLGARKTLQKVSIFPDVDCDGVCMNCDRLCYHRCDDLLFPPFVRAGDIVKFPNWYRGMEIGICLYTENEPTDSFFVTPIDAACIRENRFEDALMGEAHMHADPPYTTLVALEELSECDRENRAAFLAYLDAHDLQDGERP